MNTKFCTSCKIEKQTSEFWRDNRRKDGFQCLCKLCLRIFRKKHNKKPENKEKLRIQCLAWRNKNRSSWNEYFPEKMKCSICLKEVFFNGSHRNITINFYHRQECMIKTAPSKFINSHVFNEKNKKIWESCNFGILCLNCNILLPTHDRDEWLNRVIAYVGNKR